MLSPSSGTGSVSDPYRTAVVDTIVSEIQSTPGEDRCVLLLGYKDQMETMFQNVNPGLARRFPLDNAFNFEDYDSEQLLDILNFKLGKQGLDASQEAKKVAIDVLARARRKPNFGNAGEVENLISVAKDRYQSRQSKVPLAERPADIIFEPQDFDPNFDRGTKAVVNCSELFRDVIGCEEIVTKLEGMIRSVETMRARNIKPEDHIPFNFVFKGPPGKFSPLFYEGLADILARHGEDDYSSQDGADLL
jgi:AAA lid domain